MAQVLAQVSKVLGVSVYAPPRPAARALYIVAALFGPSTAYADVEYIYGESGRLVGVIAPSGDAARYTYDAAGNITAIERISAGAVSILDFTPDSGLVGAVVIIRGTGFSTTPSQNTVAFNGVAATVSARVPRD